MRQSLFVWAPTLALAILLGACATHSVSTANDDGSQIAEISGLGTRRPAISMPSLVRPDEYFSVNIHTTWQSGCARRGNTLISQHGRTITITPYNFVSPDEESSAMCMLSPRSLTHQATLRLSKTGEYRVVVVGRDTEAGGIMKSKRTVTVR